ncbi:hypothetical protein PoB_004851700 [Plakobranchus ocellatus]|uniref:HTH CENPB-type domain-containing protein n=1 Tax=Plakobranchus ocellatus TaxID=259542 RepID=A0AAV4BRM1_9GAST|nr:hypothetical protein PoB_004851700 [Plakobranchus ocellatus]
MAPKYACKYTEADVQAAIVGIRKQKLSQREAARQYNVPESTLRGRLQGRASVHTAKPKALSPQEEEKIVDWLKESARKGFGHTRDQIAAAVRSIVSGIPGKVTPFKDNGPGYRWYRGFMKRHSHQIGLSNRQALRAQRAAVSAQKIKLWFEIAEKEIGLESKDVLGDPNRIFNCDESTFKFGGGVAKTLAPVNKRINQVTKETHKQINVLACGSAAGNLMAPLIIFPGQRFTYDPLEGFPEAHLARSGNGWLDMEIFERWLLNAFVPAVSHLPKPVVFFVDGLKTDNTMKVHDNCKEHGIILYSLPSKASHIVQPLDLTTFKNLKQSWREEVVNFKKETSNTLSKKDFSKVFKKAWDRGVDRSAVSSGFRAAGIFPWNPDHVDLSKLDPSRVFRQTDKTSDHENNPDGTDSSTRSICSSALEELVDKGLTIASDVTTAPTDDLTDGTCDINQPSTSTAFQENDNPLTFPESFPVIQTLTPSPETCLDMLLDLTAKIGGDKLVTMRIMYNLQEKAEDPETKIFFRLYGTILERIHNDNEMKPRTFENLPLASRSDFEESNENKKKAQDKKKKQVEKSKKRKLEENNEKGESKKRKITVGTQEKKQTSIRRKTVQKKTTEFELF